MPTSLGPAEILVILVVALIVLGPKRLPEAGRQVGKAIAEVRKWSQGFQDEIRSAVDYDPGPPSYPAPPAGSELSTLPMVPAETGPPAEVAAAPPPPADTNGSSATTETDGPAQTVPAPEAAETDTAASTFADPTAGTSPDPTAGPPAGEPPRA